MSQLFSKPIVIVRPACQRLFAVAMGTLLTVALAASASSAGGLGLLDQTGCSVCCPECKHVCKLDAEEIEEEKKCFKTESKVICIPRVVFPWQKAKRSACDSCRSCDGKGCTACVHNGARTRKVCVLKTEKYKCPACKYTWSAEKKPCGGCAAPCDSGCCESGTCDAGCSSFEDASIVAPMPAASVTPWSAPADESMLPYDAPVVRPHGGLIDAPISNL